MHFLLQDDSQQASFSWHDDASDVGHEGMHMTTVIVSLSIVPSCMRMWGFQPFLFQGLVRVGGGLRIRWCSIARVCATVHWLS